MVRSNQQISDIVRNAMITAKQCILTECPFLSHNNTKGFIAVHFAPKYDPRVTWGRDMQVQYKGSQPVAMNIFSRSIDKDHMELALEVIEYTIYQYIHPQRKVISGKIEFSFQNGLICNIMASGNLVFADCGE